MDKIIVSGTSVGIIYIVIILAKQIKKIMIYKNVRWVVYAGIIINNKIHALWRFQISRFVSQELREISPIILCFWVGSFSYAFIYL